MKTTDKFLSLIVAPVILSGCLFFLPVAQAQDIALGPPEPARSSTAAGTTMANSISPAGPTVAFVSDADDLVPHDHNRGKLDVFIRNFETGETRLVSVNASGEGSGNGDSNYPMISSDARYVVFESKASDLVENDVNNASDVFIRDLVENTTTLISSTPGEGGALSESRLLAATADAGYIAFKKRDVELDRIEAGRPLPGWRLYVYHREENTATLITQNANDGGAASLWPNKPIALSSEDATLAFFSPSPDLSDQPPPEELEGQNLPHLYVKNLASGEIRRIDPGQYVAEIPADELKFLDIPFITLSADGEILVISLATWRRFYWIRYDLLTETFLYVVPEGILRYRVFVLPPAVSTDGNSIVIIPNDGSYDPPTTFWYNPGDLIEEQEFIDGLSGDRIRIGTAILSADGRKILLDDQLYDRDTKEWKSILPESAGIDERFPLFGALADPDLDYILFHNQNGSLTSDDGNQAIDAFLYDAANDSIQAVSLRHPDSPPSLRNGLRVSWTDVSPNDVVQYKNDLSRENWNDLQAEIQSEDSTGSAVDPSAGLFSRRFYRVRRGE